MAKIRLKYPAYCTEETCGAYLPEGTLVRYYGRNGIYGIGCHTKLESIQGGHSRFRENEQQKARKPVRYEIGEETYFGTPCGHEDYPCCGCSDEYNQRFG